MGLTIGVRFIEGGKSKRAVIISKIKGEECLHEWNDEVQDQQVTQERVVPQDPRQAGHMPETEPEMSRLERQPMLKNPPQVQDREGGKDQ